MSGSSNTPPGVPPQSPHWPAPAGGNAASPRESRGVAFFVAILLGILLLASAGLNVLLLLLSVGSLASGAIGVDDGGIYDEVHIEGERDVTSKVLQVAVRGAIAEGANPVLGAGGGSVTQVQRALRRAAADDIEGVLLFVDSPGGGVTDSERIHAMLKRFRAEHPEKPMMALFGDMAASGGYYVAVAAEHIVAGRTTITGSIGVIMSAWNFAEAAKKFGVEQVAIKSERTPFKDILSPTRQMTDAERAMLTGIVDELYDRFVEVVDEGRPGLDREAVVRAASGAIYTARQARELGLIDDVGSYDTALQWFQGRLGHPVRIVEHRRRVGLLDMLAGAAAPSPGATGVESLLLQSTGPRFLYFWQGGR
ncbi:MAG: signal peptide peptidase SppA [Planctomycetota bacterium]